MIVRILTTRSQQDGSLWPSMPFLSPFPNHTGKGQSELLATNSKL